MPNEATPKPANDPRIPPPAGGPPLSDADVNRQMGEGRSPDAAAGAPDTIPLPDRSARELETGAHRAAGSEHTAEGEASDGVETVLQVGRRDLPPLSEGGDKNVYDRLAEKDRVADEQEDEA